VAATTFTRGVDLAVYDFRHHSGVAPANKYVRLIPVGTEPLQCL
jgi:hypothetical protein